MNNVQSRRRKMKAWGLFAAGFTYREIGATLGGVSSSRARQMVEHGARIIRHRIFDGIRLIERAKAARKSRRVGA